MLCSMTPQDTLEIMEGILGGPAGAAPVASLIVLHGLGADGNDFVPIAQQLDLTAVGPVRFVFPSAPVRPVTINGGFAMRAWYDIAPPDSSGVRVEDEAGLRASQGLIQQLLDRELERGVPAERTVLMGFSQGCAMSLMAGLRAPQRLAGIVGWSGYLPLPATTAAERSPANQGTPILLAHGEHDDVVALERGLASRDLLQALGHDVTWRSYPMAHSVCPQQVADLNAWLLPVLGVGR
jgi:phospholipase/carboxylesterase